MTPAEGAILAAAAAAAGAVNSVAGGGTLISFPALLAMGFDPKVANATSTVALWPGAWGAMGGYRKDLAGARPMLVRFGIPSLLGGGLGAWLMVSTSRETFAFLVPWLVLFATVLFAASERIAAWWGAREGDAEKAAGPGVLLYQFAVAVYGGYFGAGIGILMLAALSLLGMRDIHRMNGVKMTLGMLINAVAIAIFVCAGDLVRWPEGILMAVAALLGGFGGARLAKRVPRGWIRALVIATGLVVAAEEFWKGP